MATKTGDCVELCETFGVQTVQLSRTANVTKANFAAPADTGSAVIRDNTLKAIIKLLERPKENSNSINLRLSRRDKV